VLLLKPSRPCGLRSLLPRPMTAQGINYTIVNGEMLYEDGKHTAVPWPSGALAADELKIGSTSRSRPLGYDFNPASSGASENKFVLTLTLPSSLHIRGEGENV